MRGSFNNVDDDNKASPSLAGRPPSSKWAGKGDFLVCLSDWKGRRREDGFSFLLCLSARFSPFARPRD